MNGTVTMSSSELIVVADNIKDIEKLIDEAKEENKDNMLKAWERVEEIDEFNVGILKNNKIEKINIIGVLKDINYDSLLTGKIYDIVTGDYYDIKTGLKIEK